MVRAQMCQSLWIQELASSRGFVNDFQGNDSAESSESQNLVVVCCSRTCPCTCSHAGFSLCVRRAEGQGSGMASKVCGDGNNCHEA